MHRADSDPSPEPAPGPEVSERSYADPSGQSDRRAFSVRVRPRDAELTADRLWLAGASAVAERDLGHEVELVADLAPDVAESLRHRAGIELRLLDPAPVVAHRVERRRCGDRLLLVPADGPAAEPAGDLAEEPVDDPAGGPATVVLRLEAGQAFGGGSHPSTRTCLAALEPLAPRATTVLDVGSGTGVLAVAALLLGAGSAVAVDTDPEAVRATTRTAELNGVAGRLVVRAGSLPDVAGQGPVTADLVVANLLLPVIEQLGSELVARVAPGGDLVLGGVLGHQRDRAVLAVAPLVVVGEQTEGDWLALVLRHPGPVLRRPATGAPPPGRPGVPPV